MTQPNRGTTPLAPAAKSPVPFLDTARSIWRSHLTGDYLRRKDRAAALFLRHYGTRVLQGPFAGMNYLNRSHNSEFMPKLLGSYEAELTEVLEQIIAHDYPLIVDVGCAEGYYAVGLARRCPQAKVEAFDIDPEAQKSCAEMARMNGLTEQIMVRGACSPEALNKLDLTGALLICDCEGFEDTLLNPAQAPGLAECDFLVELHDFNNPQITTNLLQRFSRTHHIRLIPSVNRNPDLYPSLWFLKDRRDREIALSEQRVPMNWAFGTVRK